MIMWELTTGCKPFANVEHDIYLIIKIIDGARPEITEDTPECYTNLMKSCWDSDPKRRPSISVIRDICFKLFCQLFNSTNRSFDQADLKSNTLIDSKKLGLKFSEKTHPKAIYTSRSLNSYISKCSSIFSKCSSIKFSSNGMYYIMDKSNCNSLLRVLFVTTPNFIQLKFKIRRNVNKNKRSVV
ncbi:kinase-like domain-containing protein [Rhizophagus irregularis DAOM 181602=DAOM 197198]|nr:kinase-like domain-containing protein [Rhizophagus irregularis DAOM 181602=DAOM 197198]